MTLASHGEAWQGNWQARLASELRRLGVDSLRAFAKRHGYTTYSAIAAALDGPFAPIQMVMTTRSEFESEADLAGFATDCLYRYLVEYTLAPSSDRHLREKQAIKAISACSAALGAEHGDAILQVWRMLRDKITDGWQPSGPDDAILRDSVSAVWQRSG